MGFNGVRLVARGGIDDCVFWDTLGVGWLGSLQISDRHVSARFQRHAALGVWDLGFHPCLRSETSRGPLFFGDQPTIVSVFSDRLC